MAVLIRAERVERKIRTLAKQNGETLTDAVEKAVDDRLAATAPKRKGRVDHEGLAQLLAELNALPRANEHLSDDDIVGYNDEGHFD
ncbi:MAG TPA: type II toxin-antitoxin system VapB family antitoxin [Beijerinckiaceae bacterium]|jgi:antitoxin VapB